MTRQPVGTARSPHVLQQAERKTESNEASLDMESAMGSSGERGPLIGKSLGGHISSSSSKFAPRKYGGRNNTPMAALPMFIMSLTETFGYKLMIMLFAVQHLMKGFSQSFVGPATQYLWRSYSVAGPHMQIFSGVVGLPWAMKPIVGLVSDCFPIGGYNKKPYIILSSLLGVAGCATVGMRSQGNLSVECIVVCLFLMQLQFSTCDLLTEAKYSEKMQAHPERGPDLMTYVWFGLQCGGLAATLLVGPVIHHFGPKVPFAVALLPLSFILWPVYNNFMEETPKSREEIATFRKRMLAQKELCFLCVLMFFCTLALSAVGMLFESVYLSCGAAVLVATVVLIAFSIVLSPLTAKVNAFFLIQTSMGFSIDGAAFYFFTDTPEQYPEGPHFSQEFFTSVLGVVGALCSLTGIYFYNKHMSGWSYRRLLFATNLTVSVLSAADVLILSRFNVRLGIPDSAFVLGGTVLTTVISQWMWMPGVVLNSQLCPEGMEATMYALLAGCHNLGSTISANTGAMMLVWLGCTPSGQPGESMQFKSLWKASLLSTVLPMFTLFLLPWMIPDAKQTDKLLADGERDATRGSLWKRWMCSLEGRSA